MKPDAFRQIKEFLISGGFDTFDYPRGCFDLAARRDRFLLLKILTNVDSFQRAQAKDMKLLSEFLDSSCFVLGQRTRKEKLRDSVVYERFGIPAMTPDTFTSVIEGNYPEKFRTRGGFFGRIDHMELREQRRKKDMTQTELAERLGISQKSISEYESGKKRVLLDMIEALEELLCEDIREGINPFEIKPKIEREKKGNEVCRRLTDLGFEAGSVKRAPAKFLAKEDSTILSKVIGSSKKMGEIDSLAGFSEISATEAFVITDKKTGIEEVPPVRMEELEEIESSKELIKLIKEKRETSC